MEAIVTTFDAILYISLDLKRRTVTSQVVHQGYGIYFGVTRHRNQILVAASDLDMNRVPNTKVAPNIIYSLDTTKYKLRPAIRHECLKDLHQIRMIERWVCVVVGEGSKLAVFERDSGELTREVDLAEYVSPHLRHGAPEKHKTDPYHFNSLFFTKRQLFVLAHNWDFGSFVLKFEYSIDDRGPCEFKLLKVYEQLGLASHDVVYADGSLYVLDSWGSKLIVNSTTQKSFPLPDEADRAFPRGLSITKDYILICYGFWSAELAGRLTGDTRLCVLNRRTMQQIMDVAIGCHGNSCDIIVISEKDWSDQTHTGLDLSNLFWFFKAAARRFQACLS
jgi:hypothetical protein